ncbi:hypothetical protein BYT27DRAFT_7249778 [Phlegmacium glaucopus]|nr:hypothetical protein BYT27DRAFT_7249778 [Phlegmacium glaucopus]
MLPSSLLNFIIIPSESSFKKHADLSHKALKNFNTIRSFLQLLPCADVKSKKTKTSSNKQICLSKDTINFSDGEESVRFLSSAPSTIVNTINKMYDSSATVPMDTSSSVPSESNVICAHTVHLLYSSILNMDYSSRAYIKAITIISKQVHKGNHTLVTCTQGVEDDSMSLNKLVLPISAVDNSSISHARDTISNSVIVDLIKEDSHFDMTYQNALHCKIVEGCNLASVDVHTN